MFLHAQESLTVIWEVLTSFLNHGPLHKLKIFSKFVKKIVFRRDGSLSIKEVEGSRF